MSLLLRLFLAKTLSIHLKFLRMTYVGTHIRTETRRITSSRAFLKIILGLPKTLIRRLSVPSIDASSRQVNRLRIKKLKLRQILL